MYVNCEDYKHHTFPNVLIEILDAIFSELEQHLNAWFGKKRQLKALIGELRKELVSLREEQDELTSTVKETEVGDKTSLDAGAGVHHGKIKSWAFQYQERVHRGRIPKVR